MKKFLLIFFLSLSFQMNAQIGATEPLHFEELGSEPAFCRKYGYQSGNGVVYAAAAGGVPDYDYQWTHEVNGPVTSMGVGGGLGPGWYYITVTDDIGTQIYDSVYVDSLSPEIAFEFFSGDLVNNNGVYEGVVPVELELGNYWGNTIFAKPDYPGYQGPYWVSYYIDGFGWSDSINFIVDFQGPQFYNINQMVQGEICLAVRNFNGCVDTSCFDVDITYPSAFVAPTEIVGVSCDYQTKELTFWNLDNGQYRIVILNQNGLAVDEVILDAGSVNLFFEQQTGIYFYQVHQLQTDQIIEAGKFLY